MKGLWTSRIFHTVLLLALLGGLLFVRAKDDDWVKSLRYLAFDTYNQIWPRPPTDEVVIVDIDEKSLKDEHLGQWPWPRTDVARLVDNLKDMGAKAIVFDMVFAEEDRTSPKTLVKKLPQGVLTAEEGEKISALPDHDQVLADSFKNAGNVVTGFIWSENKEATRHMPVLSRPVVMAKGMDLFETRIPGTPGVTTNLLSLEESSSGNGCFGVSPEVDGIVRQVPLFFRVLDGEGRGHVYPSLALEALRVAKDFRLSHKVRPLKESELTVFSPPYLLKVGDYNAPVDEDGTFYVYYSPARPDQYISAWDAFTGTVQRNRIQGKIVLVGTSAGGLKDIRSTPLNLYIPGVEMHLNIIEQVFQGEFLSRPLIVQGAEWIFAGLIGLLLIAMAPFINALSLGAVVVAIVSGVFYASVTMFHKGILVDPVYPALTILVMFVLSSLLTYVRAEMERRAVKQAFGLYISPDYMKELTKHPDQLRLGGEIRDISVMFTDIRSFTTISEQLPPADLIQLMNEFLTPMSDLVMSNKGTIDKYMGDAMMAFWNAPMEDSDHARNACITALAMNDALTPINEKLAAQAKEQGREPIVLRAGIGINSGPGAVGNMGSRQRFAYSVLGDTVNLASRLESQTKSYGVDVLIGEETARAVPDFAVLELDLLQVKGKTEPARIYTLLGRGRTEQFEKLEKEHAKMLRLYRAGDFAGAAGAVENSVLWAPSGLSGYYAMMRERVEEMQKSGLPADWDGVYTAKTK
jgi:adenylate cyclase